jgi:uncharacterized MAPEG superfamily protein
LLGFAAWTLLLVCGVVTYRVFRVAGGQSPTVWTRGGPAPGPELVKRMEHAHLNCLENLPVFAAIVLGAVAMGKGAVVDAYAPYVLLARIAQSLAHLVGVTPMLVNVRATFFAIQVGLFVVMLCSLLA